VNSPLPGIGKHKPNGEVYVSVLHGVLAISLIEQRKDISDALEHLKQAAAEFPFVRLLAMRALAEVGRRDLALIQVGAYLQSSAHECERPTLEAWVASVQQQLPRKSNALKVETNFSANRTRRHVMGAAEG
jgi:hypothetical protein